jgi:membrane fusion protein (multidrug efflux system)
MESDGRGENSAGLAHAGTHQRQPRVYLSYAQIVAPIDGVVGNHTLRVGQHMQAGTQLMTVVRAASAYIVANFKETQLINAITLP